eukprot:5583762-Prorocentrum_lima.AAC.1
MVTVPRNVLIQLACIHVGHHLVEVLLPLRHVRVVQPLGQIVHGGDFTHLEQWVPASALVVVFACATARCALDRVVPQLAALQLNGPEALVPGVTLHIT